MRQATEGRPATLLAVITRNTSRPQPYLGYSDICILTAEHAKAGFIVGSVASGYTMRTLGMSVAGYVQDLLQRLCGIA